MILDNFFIIHGESFKSTIDKYLLYCAVIKAVNERKCHLRTVFLLCRLS